jgi:hypothetical protein
MACSLLSCVPAWAGGAVAADQEPLPAGQMLVKFTTGGVTDSEAARLLASGESASDALDAFAEELSATLDVPLFVRQITSGRELVLEIERSGVLETVARRLRDSPEVVDVQVDRAAGAQRHWMDRLLLAPAPGGELAHAAAMTDEAHAARAVQRQLAAQLSHPHYVFTARPVSAHRIVLRIDLQATTMNLVKALQAQHGVEYAQPNFVATIN